MNPALTAAERKELLKRARAANLERRAPALLSIEPADRAAPLALSFAQARLWFLERLGELGATYHIPVRLRLRGALDAGVLRRALDRIVARHEALRTVFVAVDGEPEQRVAPAQSHAFHLVEHDLAGHPDPGRMLRRLVDEEANAPFDLARGPLIRGRLARMAADDHVLLLTMHHIVSDGWSMGVLVSELSALYTAFARGEADPLPALAVQYADYAAWQRRRVAGEALEAQGAYWTEALSGAPELLELPTDRPRPAQQDFAGASLGFELDEVLAAGLRALAHRHGATLFMTVMAGWAAVLGRLSGQDDVVVGTPTANRAHPEVEGLIGFFVNTLALRIDLSGAPAVSDLLARVKARTLEAQANQDIPFEQVVDRVSPARSLAHGPVFQVMLAWQNAPEGTLELPGLTLEPVEGAAHETAKFDLFLTLIERGGRIVGRAEYATALFDHATVERYVGYFRRVLEEMAAGEDVRVDQLRMLPDDERRQVVDGWNATEAAYPSDRCIHALFEAEAAREPEALAAVFGGEALAYAELNRSANRLAHYLVARGVGPDVRVAVCVERGVEMMVALLAVLKAGGAYVPLDPAYPEDRLRYVLRHAGPALLLTQESLRDRFAGSDVDLLSLDADAALWADEAETNPEVEGLTPDHLSYVIYTSGSTGTPKGVMNTHRGVVNLLASIQRGVAMAAGDRLLAVTTLSFDISVLELFLPFLSGARVEILSRAAASDPSLLRATIGDGEATVLQATPATWRLLLDSGWAGAPRLRALSGGEALPVALAARLRERVAALWNVYGPTETTIWSSAHAVETSALHDRGHVPIGAPLANTRFYVLDRCGDPVPVGVAGELYIGGAGVARGYFRQPALTAERFVPDAFSPAPGARAYRTGDLARWRADGTGEFLGRNDHQVKVRGYRIELGEIEARLAEHGAVREAVVVAREDGMGEKRLVAYVVPEWERVDEAAAGPEEAGDGWEAEHQTDWMSAWDYAYGKAPEDADPTFDISGWNSSYTGEPVPPEEMREWVEATVARIRSLAPRRVLEIGCGTGLLLSRVAPHCERYVGTDFSPRALAAIERLRRARPELAHVEPARRTADDFGGFEPGSFDTVVINSVVQYLPSLEYLERVLEGAARVLVPGGRIFVGDVRDLRLLGAFHTAIETFRSRPGRPVTEWRDRAEQAQAQEEELVIDPAFFWSLGEAVPAIRRVETLARRGRFRNELTEFRYDAVLHVASDDGSSDGSISGSADGSIDRVPGGSADAPAGGSNPGSSEADAARIDWEAARLTLAALRAYLESAAETAVLVQEIPNARVSAALRALDLRRDPRGAVTVDEVRRAAPGDGVDPEALWALGEALGWRVEVRLADSDDAGRVDARFVRRSEADEGRRAFPARRRAGRRELAAYATDPLRGRRTGTLVRGLREHLAGRLPEYMVPASYVALERLPLTPNGKVDRKALPAPEGETFARRAYEAPAGETEVALAAIWQEVLGVDGVGRRDNFFQLGGHSLLAVRVIERMRRRGLHAEVGALFTAPTLAGLAAAVGGASAVVEVPPNGIPTPCARVTPGMLTLVSLTQAQIDAVAAGVEGGAANVRDVYPLAPLQEGILFHHLTAAKGDPYLMSGVYAFDRRERLDAWTAALQAVVDRHDVLRTAVVWEGLPEPVQVVWREARLAVEEVELDPSSPDPARELWNRHGPRENRVDVRRAPLIRLHAARDGGRWLLLFQIHHLCSDHTSLDVLRAEVEAHLEGRVGELPAPPPFRDYVAQARLGVSRGEHEAYFRALLADVDEPTAPFGLLDAWGDGSGTMDAQRPVETALALRLRDRARRMGVSAASLCHLAFAQVLARVSGKRDVVFGTVLFGRMQGGEGTERGLGPFINTLAVRIRVGERAGEDGAEAGVREAHRQLAALMRHEHAPLSLAQRCSGVEAPTPLFTALLNYRHGRGPEAARAGSAAREGMRGVLGEVRTNYPFTLSVDDRGDALSFHAFAPSSVGPERVCALMHRALEGLVDALEDAPNRPVGMIDVLPEAERRLVVETWNATDAELPPLCLHELFEAQAERTPHAPAVVCEGEALTYAELNARANRIAHHLRAAHGVGPDVRVGLCVERGAEMMPALLGVLKAGGAYVALDPEYPEDRLRYMLADSAPAVLLTSGAAAARLGGGDVPAVALGRDAAAWADRPSTNPERDGLTPAHLAYLIYTSGSTGRPKGVMVEHRSAVNVLRWMGDAWPLGPGDAVLQKTPYSFDASLRELLPPLFAGARLVMARPGGHRDPAYMLETLRRERITALHFVPTMLQALVAEPELARCTSVARVVCGGEPLPPGLARAFFQRLPNARLHNVYGPTEAAVDVTEWRCAVGDAGERVPIGRPMANVRMYVLGADGHPVPAGVAGEVHVGGVQVARGYRGRPALTAERFVPDPFSSRPGARLYRTGDLGRWRADGTIELLGRGDAQVKVRGFRIELGEIEARLKEHPAVHDAVVVARRDGPGEARLVAYHVGSAPGSEALRAHLAERLPEYMVPVAYVALDAFPRTPNGKLDRRALPAPGEDAFARRGHEPPATEVEAALAEVWAEVLRVERVGRWDHFFELGGHSLLAVQVASRVRQVLGVEVALGDVFDRPVLADAARALEEAARAPLPPIEPTDRGGRVPLSFAQARLWFLEELGDVGGTYHVPKRLRLKGRLDRDALERALARIVARHEALRTVFVVAGGEPEQRIASAGKSRFHLVQHDLAGSADAEAELRRVAAEEAAAPFDLSRGPLVRGRLVRMAGDDHALLLTMHHIVSDAWSTGVLVHELGALYAAFARGEGDPLPPLPVQYADYAAWQRRWVEGEVLRAQAGYWTRALAGAPALLELPTDRPRPARRDHAGAAVPVELPPELVSSLQALSRRHGATLFMTLLAGWSVVLGRLSGEDDVVVGTPTANRGRREIEGLIGFFVNTLALRIDLSDSPTVSGLLARVKARALEAQANQDIPFEQVVERVSPARSLAHTPVFQVMFAWQNAPRDRLQLPGLELSPVDGVEQTTAKFDLSLSLGEGDGRIAGRLEYATALFDRATAERFVACLRRALEEMAADPDRRVDLVSVLPEAERLQVVDTWNATEAEYPRDACIHALIEAQVARTPDAVAVTFEGASLTYDGLNRRANRLAHHLIDRGVGPDVRVGVCVERSLDLAVALLAVLKAGGAYVPLDPEYPEDRLRYMLADAAPAVLLTESSLRARFEGLDAPVISLDADAHTWADQPDADPVDAGVGPDHLAYVIYTSGSTGRPKGVMNLHRGLVNRLVWGLRVWPLEAGEAVLLKTSLSFDGLVRELFLPLMSGARVVVARPGGHRDPAYLLETVRAEGIGTMNLVPSLLQVLLEDPSFESCRGLKRVLCGGEALPAALLGRFRERMPEVEIHNLYGPSEAATALVNLDCAGAEGRGTVPIGRGIANTRVYVLDRAGHPVPIGAAGELTIGGAGVARGYLARPELTAERFVADPFSSGPGARLYRTGDLARWLPDGSLEFLGRNDHQVKVRGFRIEPGEIEAALAGHPAVREAVVVAREDAPGGARLVAYLVAADAVATEALRAHLAARLPEYMVPAAYVRLAALPLTPSGKVDRGALPAPEGEAFARRGYEAPAGETEEALAAMWTELLGVERVGRHDDFFELGGHSLLASRLVLRIRREMEVDLALRDVFEKPVLSALAHAVVLAQLAQFDSAELEALKAMLEDAPAAD